ncbi:hypothetical protein ACWIGN_32720, partial [Streptomyces albidoflavus]
MPKPARTRTRSNCPGVIRGAGPGGPGVRLAARLRELILAGAALRPGTVLPPTRAVAAEFGLSPRRGPARRRSCRPYAPGGYDVQGLGECALTPPPPDRPGGGLVIGLAALAPTAITHLVGVP